MLNKPGKKEVTKQRIEFYGKVFMGIVGTDIWLKLGMDIGSIRMDSNLGIWISSNLDIRLDKS